ncbi:cytochrome ubiquinol oxidase subunit I, partial [Rhizobium leguminosarum]|uniref:cytochrome ubiquinol oxidase subunit I n=1 Tax=Rhizobium leguminosarum TaxID=384 RepID=UPI003F9AE8E9
AIEFGWIVAEFGRQPWVIDGVLPTAAAVSSLGAGTVILTIIGFAALYTTLIVIEMGLMKDHGSNSAAGTRVSEIRWAS